MVRAGELQVGGGFSGGDGDYSPHRFYGPYFYATFDFRDHIGIDAEFRQVNDTSASTHTNGGNDSQGIYERTYQIGPRYVWHYGRFNPYFKLLAGRGVFNYPNSVANLAYDMWSAGGGVDMRATRYLNIRLVDFESQQWVTFSPNNLAPNILSVGAAYRFH